MKLSRSTARLSLPALGAATLGLALGGASTAQAFWVDGDGHYGLRGSTETAPAFSHDRGTFQAVEQTFRLTGEARPNDQLSMFFELGLFEDPRQAYLGDTGQPADCAGHTTAGAPASNPCTGQHQSTGEPGYKNYSPHITKAYVRYAFDYCLLEAGRRGRNWGLGMYLDDGTKPFSTTASVFDGVTCNINIQKSQTLGFSVGWDKLTETGSPVDPYWRATPPTTAGGPAGPGNAPSTGSRQFGPNDPNDDLDQYFFTIEYDDRKANAGSFFTKQVGVYFAQVQGKPYKTADAPNDPANPAAGSQLKETGGDGTDLKFVDLYTGFYFGDVAVKNELLFRMGKSMDPNWVQLGGTTGTGGPVMNNLDSAALAGEVEWTLAHSGAAIGPAEFNKGDLQRHVLFFDYAYAPGDGEGYRTFDIAPTVAGLNSTDANNLTRGSRSTNVKAMQFNRNFKPALLLFNARPQADDLIVDGAFNPSRMVNATLLALGYRYENMLYGDFETKLITASLNEGVPNEVKSYYAAINGTAADNGLRPAGFYGKSLGTELDLSYTYKVGREVELGAAAALALPGKAWEVNTQSRTGLLGSQLGTDFLLQTTAVFHF